MQTVTTVKDFEQVIHQLETLKENVRKIEESKTNEHNFVVHNNIVLLEVDRKAVEGDFVVFNGLSTVFTTNDKFYEVCKPFDTPVYYDDENYIRDVYAWLECPEPKVKVYEVIGNLPQSTPVAYSTKPSCKHLTANQKRAMIILEAKQFVEQTVKNAKSGLRNYEGNYTYQHRLTDVHFVVKADEREVTAVAKDLDGKVVEKAIAKCVPDDVFNADIGKAIAVGRLFDLNVERFVNAIKPDKKAVGQLEIEGNLYRYVNKVIAGNPGCLHDVANPKTPVAILDDTNAQYEGGDK